jgi:predicted metal-dependent phosphoesterase TrpH
MKEVDMQKVERLLIKSVNLHIHTRCSDGGFSPNYIMEKAQQSNIDIISITDHDSVEAYSHALKSHIPVRLLPGIELSSTLDGSDVHILGYGIDVKNQPLLEILDWMKDGRKTRAQKMLQKLTKLGISIPFENVLAFAGEMKLIVRPHIAQALVEGKHCRNKQEAFDKFIGNDSPAYVPKPILSSADAIRYIHNAGGVAIVAHPGKLRKLDYLYTLVDVGLDGVEVWHPDHNELLMREFHEFCAKNGLLQTGGSDFHGEEDVHNYFGSVPVSDLVLQDIQSIWDNYKCRIQA